MRTTLITTLAVAIGGAAGALGRWLIARTLQPWTFGAMPLGTAAANLIGCFAIGLCYVWLVERTDQPALRMGLMTGLLGAMTTFSTFALETVNLLEQRRYTIAALNVFGSAALGLLAVIAAIALARRFF